MTSRFDLDRYGFDRAEITSLLAKHGIQIDADAVRVDHAPVQSFPAWKQVMGRHPVLTEKDAAYAIVGIDPYASGYFSDDEYAELSRWTDLILAAITTGELVAVARSPNPDGSENWAIKPADLFAWCTSGAIQYPLPTPVTIPPTDAGLRDALASSEQDRARWKAQAESLGRSADQCKELQREIEGLRKELREKEDVIGKLNAERESLNSDALKGKQKTTALKIIGGLAIVAYRINLHDSRLSGIGEIVADLQKAGAGIEEKTLRAYLKEAGEIIEPNPKKSSSG